MVWLKYKWQKDLLVGILIGAFIDIVLEKVFLQHLDFKTTILIIVSSIVASYITRLLDELNRRFARND